MRFSNIVLAVFSFVSSQAAARDQQGGDRDEWAGKDYDTEDIEKEIFNLRSSLGDMEQEITNIRANALSANEHFDYSSLKEKGSGYEDTSRKYLRDAHTILDEGNTEFDSARGSVDDGESRETVGISAVDVDHLRNMTTIFGKGYAVPVVQGGKSFLPLVEHGARARLFDVNIPDSSFHTTGDTESNSYEETTTSVEKLISTYGAHLGFGGEMFGIFKLSLALDFSVQELEYASNFFYMRQLTAKLAFIDLDLHTARDCLTTEAKEAMEAIRTDEQAKRFIANFGMAYTSRITVGGMYNMRAHETDKNYFSETEFKSSMSSAFSSLPSRPKADGNINVQIGDSKRTRSVTAEYVMRGGDVLATSFDEWIETVENSPSVISYQLEPIYLLAEHETSDDSPRMLLTAAYEETLENIPNMKLPVKQVQYVTVTNIDVVSVHDWYWSGTPWNRIDEIVLKVDGVKEWPRNQYQDMHHNSKHDLALYEQKFLERPLDDEPMFCLYDLNEYDNWKENMIECHKFTSRDVKLGETSARRKFTANSAYGEYTIDFMFYTSH